MELEKIARQLGAAIQKDETYLEYQAAMKANDEDSALNELMSKIRLLQMNYQAEAQKENADESKLNSYQQEFQGLYAQIMSNETMQKFEKARQAVDDMMNYLTGILALCVNGEDPETCDPKAHMHDHDCGGECSTCGGCH
ncbi:MAG: YlbF family regulator [Ruminococcaceae bacterium]|nr:YlbF family regulator [Oscillospiraceae bacterium]